MRARRPSAKSAPASLPTSRRPATPDGRGSCLTPLVQVGNVHSGRERRSVAPEQEQLCVRDEVAKAPLLFAGVAPRLGRAAALRGTLGGLGAGARLSARVWCAEE